MPLSPGTHLGPYEILAPIGAGGMGEVYRARDPRLGRDVAIKISAQQFTERFEREARAIAALNHANICQIYDVARDYLVMEYIEGVEPKGPYPLDEALRIARQIADALEAAHEKGIVHRDLKPANIIITPAGTVKVLDFGLAKAAEPDPTGNPQTSPTLTMRATQMGMILGTAGYMSPEQARGKIVDKRADIWAFGVVLYEVLTGERLFGGDDVADVLAAVIKDEPDWRRVPLQVQRLLKGCLQKDPKQRLRDIGDVWKLLDDAPVGRGQARLLPWAIAGVALLIAAAGAYWLRPSSEPERVSKLSITPPDGSNFVDIAQGSPVVVSPDGRAVAFLASKSGQQQVWIRPLDSTEARPLPGTEGAYGPFWSPDSRSLGFAAHGKLKKIDISGGPAQALADAASGSGNYAMGTWNSDGKILYSLSATSNLFVVAAAGGERTEATRLDSKLGETSHLWPDFLPDGRHYLYHVRAASSTEFQIYAGTLGSSERTLLLKGVTDARYAPARGGHPGYLLFVRDGTLMAQPFDARSLKLAGDPVGVAEQVAASVNATVADFSVSGNGILAYRQGGSSSREQELVWYDRLSKQTVSIAKRPDTINTPRLSPDGRMAVFMQGRQGTGASQETWLVDLVRGVTSRFTFNGGLMPVWSPDGSQIAFSRVGDGIYRKASNGGGADSALWTDHAMMIPTDWSADGRSLLVTRVDPKNGNDIWLLPGAAGGGKPTPLLQTSANEASARFSPGPGAPRWVAYSSNESGANEVYVMSMPGPPPGRWQISSGGGLVPQWRGDGRELYYLAPDHFTIMAVDIEVGPTFRAGTPHALFQVDRLANFTAWEAAADGKKFLLAIRQQTSSTAPITIVLNWQAALPK